MDGKNKKWKSWCPYWNHLHHHHHLLSVTSITCWVETDFTLCTLEQIFQKHCTYSLRWKSSESLKDCTWLKTSVSQKKKKKESDLNSTFACSSYIPSFRRCSILCFPELSAQESSDALNSLTIHSHTLSRGWSSHEAQAWPSAGCGPVSCSSDKHWITSRSCHYLKAAWMWRAAPWPGGHCPALAVDSLRRKP